MEMWDIFLQQWLTLWSGENGDDDGGLLANNTEDGSIMSSADIILPVLFLHICFNNNV